MVACWQTLWHAAWTCFRRKFLLAVSCLLVANAQYKKLWSITNEAWQKDAVVNSGETVWAFSASDDGSVNVVGFTVASFAHQKNNGSWDAFTAKYTADGDLAWKHLHGSTGIDDATSVASGNKGQVLVAGFTTGALAGLHNKGGNDVFVTQYSSAGTRKWTSLLGSSAHEEAKAVAAGKDGSVLVAGYTEGELDGQRNLGQKDSFVAKFSGEGSPLWTRMLGSQFHDEASRVTSDIDGNIFVAGYTDGKLANSTSQSEADMFVAKYSASGQLIWVRQDIKMGLSGITAMASSTDGCVLLCGFTHLNVSGQINQGAYDAFLIKYTQEGILRWARLLGSPKRDEAWSVAALPDGSVLLAGHTEGSIAGHRNQGGRDAFAAKYSADGERLWVTMLGTPQADEAKVIACVKECAVMLVAGSTNGNLYPSLARVERNWALLPSASHKHFKIAMLAVMATILVLGMQ
jgi:hypothetical protein